MNAIIAVAKLSERLGFGFGFLDDMLKHLYGPHGRTVTVPGGLGICMHSMWGLTYIHSLQWKYQTDWVHF